MRLIRSRFVVGLLKNYEHKLLPCEGHTQDILISILKPTTFTTQSKTESIFLYLLIQMLLNLTQHADIKGLSNKTRL